MSKTRAIYRGVYILVNNILLRECGSRQKAYALIEKVTHGSSPGLSPTAPFEYLEIISALESITTIVTRTLALSTVRAFRHWTAHERPAVTRPLLFQIADSVAVLRKWLVSVQSTVDVFDENNTENLLVEMLEYWLDDMAQKSPSSPAELETALETKIPTLGPKIDPSEDLSDSLNDNDVSVDIQYDDPNVEFMGVLRDMRSTGWKESLKHRKIILLDGKHANKRARFLHWSGTTAMVIFKGEDNPISVPINRKVAVLKQKQ